MWRDAANLNLRPGASPAAIRAHYGAENTFFAAWLDTGLTHSAGRWRSDGLVAGTLEQAQQKNLPPSLCPDSNLPRISVMLAACGSRCHMMRLENAREDYAQTLVGWISRRFAKEETFVAAQGKGPVCNHIRTLRLLFLGFETGSLGSYRVSLLHWKCGQSNLTTGPVWLRFT